MRSIWTGSIGFGLVSIPVKLFSAVQETRLDLDMLDSRDHAHIKFQRVNENTKKEVPYDKIVKGYKYDDDYVIIEDADFEAAAPERLPDGGYWFDRRRSRSLGLFRYMPGTKTGT